MTFNTMKKLIKQDLLRLNGKNKQDFFMHYFFPRGEVFRYVFWMRMVQWTKSSPPLKYTFGLFCYWRLRHYEYKYGIHVNTNIYIGGGLHIMHGDGVHLNVRSIGDNVTIFQGVTCGAKGGGLPVIGDNVTIYTNSVVVGSIILGSGCTVGAQSFVDKDIPENVIVAGVPAKCLS